MRTVELNNAQCDIYDQLKGVDYIYEIGGRYSGKTYGILQMMVLVALTFPGYKWVIFRKVYGSIKSTVYEELKGVISDMGLPGCTFLTSPLYVELPNGSNFIFKGIDSVEKTKGLAGIHGAFLEELNEFTEMDFETIDNGIRGTTFPHYFFMAHNPVPFIQGGIFWFQKMFGVIKDRGRVERSEDNSLGTVLKLKTSYLDNKYCPEKRRKRLESYKITNPALYKLWACGDYAEMKGIILKGWDQVKAIPDNVELIGYGLDFGFSADPAACVEVWGSKREIWVKGVVYSTDLTNEDLYDRLKHIKRGRIVADSAEPKSIEDLYRRGLRGIKGVRKRANYKAEIAKQLQGVNIHLIEGDTDLLREFSTWSWDEDKTGKLLPRPKDGEDHYMDALVMLWHEYRGSRQMSGSGI